MQPQFVVLVGPDHAGKSSAMGALVEQLPGWRFVSVDDAFLTAEEQLVTKLRKQLVKDALPELGETYSVDFAVTLLQTAVVHLRDRILDGDPDVPVLVDSYYYKILAKIRLIGGTDNPMADWWRSFPQPRQVIYLDVDPATAWRRTDSGEDTNLFEHYGDEPDREEFVRFQRDLGRLVLDEVAHLPVTVLQQGGDVAANVAAIREELTRELV